MWIGLLKEIRELTFRALRLHRSEGANPTKGFKTLAPESLYVGQFTLSTQLIKPNYLVILPPTQHHSFFRNLPQANGFFATERFRWHSSRLAVWHSDNMAKAFPLCFLQRGYGQRRQGPVTDLPTLTVLPLVSRFFVISHGLTTRLSISRFFGKKSFWK